MLNQSLIYILFEFDFVSKQQKIKHNFVSITSRQMKMFDFS